MKIGSQVYVRGSLEAVEMYCKAFGAEKRLQIKNKSETAYEHCELWVNGQLFLAVSEAPETCNVTKKSVWQTMAFNVYEISGEEALHNTYEILREGGTVIDPPGPCPWSACCSNLIDKFGVFWWISI